VCETLRTADLTKTSSIAIILLARVQNESQITAAVSVQEDFTNAPAQATGALSIRWRSGAGRRPRFRKLDATLARSFLTDRRNNRGDVLLCIRP
jgi:hypothetical protein